MGGDFKALSRKLSGFICLTNSEKIFLKIVQVIHILKEIRNGNRNLLCVATKLCDFRLGKKKHEFNNKMQLLWARSKLTLNYIKILFFLLHSLFFIVLLKKFCTVLSPQTLWLEILARFFLLICFCFLSIFFRLSDLWSK